MRDNLSFILCSDQYYGSSSHWCKNLVNSVQFCTVDRKHNMEHNMEKKHKQEQAIGMKLKLETFEMIVFIAFLFACWVAISILVRLLGKDLIWQTFLAAVLKHSWNDWTCHSNRLWCRVILHKYTKVLESNLCNLSIQIFMFSMHLQFSFP